MSPAVIEGKVGGMFAAGDVVRTATGRSTTPFPKLNMKSEGKTRNTVVRVNAWLIDNAIAEAKARVDHFNLRQLQAADKFNPTQAERDSAELYLFDNEFVQPATRPFLKPLTTDVVAKVVEVKRVTKRTPSS